MNPPDATLWRAHREFHFRSWPDGAVVYDNASGDTHQLTLQTLKILQLLQRAPSSLQDLAAHLPVSDTPGSEPHVTIEAIVLNLNALGLIEPAPF